MRDELFDRGYQDGRDALHEGIDRLIGHVSAFVRVTGAAMNRVEWSAPWKAATKSRKSGLA